MNTYEYMQKIAVGMEQVAWDQRNNGDEFMKDFRDVEYKLRAVSIQIGTVVVCSVTVVTKLSRCQNAVRYAYKFRRLYTNVDSDATWCHVGLAKSRRSL